jgi:hypothetical protein
LEPRGLDAAAAAKYASEGRRAAKSMAAARARRGERPVQTASRERPLARRERRTLRPPTDRILARNP